MPLRDTTPPRDTGNKGDGKSPQARSNPYLLKPVTSWHKPKEVLPNRQAESGTYPLGSVTSWSRTKGAQPTAADQIADGMLPDVFGTPGGQKRPRDEASSDDMEDAPSSSKARTRQRDKGKDPTTSENMDETQQQERIEYNNHMTRAKNALITFNSDIALRLYSGLDGLTRIQKYSRIKKDIEELSRHASKIRSYTSTRSSKTDSTLGEDVIEAMYNLRPTVLEKLKGQLTGTYRWKPRKDPNFLDESIDEFRRAASHPDTSSRADMPSSSSNTGDHTQETMASDEQTLASYDASIFGTDEEIMQITKKDIGDTNRNMKGHDIKEQLDILKDVFHDFKGSQEDIEDFVREWKGMAILAQGNTEMIEAMRSIISKVKARSGPIDLTGPIYLT